MDQISDFTKVFKGTVTEAEQVKDILEKNKITSFPQKENMGHLFSLSGGHGGVRPVKFLVRTENIDQAKSMIAEAVRKAKEGFDDKCWRNLA